MRSLFGLCALALVACSSNDNKTDGGNTPDTGTGDSASGGIKQTGKVVDYQSMGAIPMATVATSTGVSVMTDANGSYALNVAKGTPFTFSIVGDAHSKLIEQEAILSGDTVRDEQLVPTSVTGLLKGFLPGYDAMKAALTIGLIKKASCKSATGATIALNPPQMGSSIKYFVGTLPDASATYADDNGTNTPRAIIYNLDPKATFTVSITWAMAGDAGADAGPAAACKMSPYPVVDPMTPTLTYTGKFLLEAGDVVSYARVFLE